MRIVCMVYIGWLGSLSMMLVLPGKDGAPGDGTYLVGKGIQPDMLTRKQCWNLLPTLEIRIMQETSGCFSKRGKRINPFVSGMEHQNRIEDIRWVLDWKIGWTLKK